MSYFFTADQHFGDDSFNILEREMRPFKTPDESRDRQLETWNTQATDSDIIYAVGDFCNYNSLETNYESGLKVAALVKANIILITGNSEDRVIKNHFGGDFESFRVYCIEECGFSEVRKEDYVTINGRRWHIVHKPVDCVDDCLNLYGHTHRGGGIYRPYGFNVGADLHHFRLVSEADLDNLLDQKEWWDKDDDILKFQ